jgi:hypothetical protein
MDNDVDTNTYVLYDFVLSFEKIKDLVIVNVLSYLGVVDDSHN